MLRYLRIFSWFLLTFGVVGFGAAVLGIDMGIGTGPEAMRVMALQVAVAAAIQWGFRLRKASKLDEKLLLYGGWGLVLLYIVLGAVLMNAGPSP